MNNNLMFSSVTDKHNTPQDLNDDLATVFDWDLDVCASGPNVCENYFNEADDGLSHDWNEWGLRWMNPPYGRTIGQWVRTAWAHRHHGATVCLLPARTDTKWWHDNIPQASQVVFIKGRLKFGDATNSAPFPSAFVVFGELSELQYAKLSEYGISYDKQNKVAN